MRQGHPEPQDAGANYPLIVPALRAATPTGLRPPGQALSAASFKTEFLSGAGPTDVFNILGSIDSQVGEINQRSITPGGQPCLSQAAVQDSVTPFGESLPFYAQCCLQGSSAHGLLQFGQKDGKVYFYRSECMGSIAAILVPPPGTDGGMLTSPDGGISDQYPVRAWVTGGRNNASSCGGDGGSFDCGSYGVVSLDAQPLSKEFEMAVAGYWPASPASTRPPPNITPDGTATDSLPLGPTTPTAGVGSF